MESDLFSYAGLWPAWRGPDEPVESCVIITTAAKETLADIHDQLLDGGEECVHVHEGDDARPVVVGVRHGASGRRW